MQVIDWSSDCGDGVYVAGGDPKDKTTHHSEQ